MVLEIEDANIKAFDGEGNILDVNIDTLNDGSTKLRDIQLGTVPTGARGAYTICVFCHVKSTI